MNYKTIDELNNFDFSESVISEVETMNGTFHLWLDNVTILPECSCNRDIRVMRANGFLLSVSNPGIQEFIEEGYKRYNADIEKYNATAIGEDYALIGIREKEKEDGIEVKA